MWYVPLTLYFGAQPSSCVHGNLYISYITFYKRITNLWWHISKNMAKNQKKGKQKISAKIDDAAAYGEF